MSSFFLYFSAISTTYLLIEFTTGLTTNNFQIPLNLIWQPGEPYVYWLLEVMCWGNNYTNAGTMLRECCQATASHYQRPTCGSMQHTLSLTHANELLSSGIQRNRCPEKNIRSFTISRNYEQSNAALYQCEKNADPHHHTDDLCSDNLS